MPFFVCHLFVHVPRMVTVRKCTWGLSALHWQQRDTCERNSSEEPFALSAIQCVCVSVCVCVCNTHYVSMYVVKAHYGTLCCAWPSALVVCLGWLSCQRSHFSIWFNTPAAAPRLVAQLFLFFSTVRWYSLCPAQRTSIPFPSVNLYHHSGATPI